MAPGSKTELIALLPHRPPMRLVEEVLEIVPGQTARCRRLTRPDDWFFDGHFPGAPIVPAVVLIELLAQTGGLALGAGASGPLGLRVAALGRFKFPAAARAGAQLDATASVTGRAGALIRIEGVVTADEVVVASGDVTLAEVASTVR